MHVFGACFPSGPCASRLLAERNLVCSQNGGITIQMWLDGWPQCYIPYLPCGTVFLLSLLVVVMVVGFWQG